jgi:hypothetical protein
MNLALPGPSPQPFRQRSDERRVTSLAHATSTACLFGGVGLFLGVAAGLAVRRWQMVVLLGALVVAGAFISVRNLDARSEVDNAPVAISIAGVVMNAGGALAGLAAGAVLTLGSMRRERS